MAGTSPKSGRDPSWDAGEDPFPDPQALRLEFALRGCDVVVRDLPPRWVGALLVEEHGRGIKIQWRRAESASHAEALGMMHNALIEPRGKPWHRFGEQGTWLYRVH